MFAATSALARRWPRRALPRRLHQQRKQALGRAKVAGEQGRVRVDGATRLTRRKSCPLAIICVPTSTSTSPHGPTPVASPVDLLSRVCRRRCGRCAAPCPRPAPSEQLGHMFCNCSVPSQRGDVPHCRSLGGRAAPRCGQNRSGGSASCGQFCETWCALQCGHWLRQQSWQCSTGVAAPAIWQQQHLLNAGHGGFDRVQQRRADQRLPGLQVHSPPRALVAAQLCRCARACTGTGNAQRQAGGCAKDAGPAGRAAGCASSPARGGRAQQHLRRLQLRRGTPPSHAPE